MNLTINPKLIFKSLFIFIILLLIANLSVMYIYLNYCVNNGIWNHNEKVKFIVKLFDFDTEKNLPTFYSSLGLLFSSILLLLIALNNKKNNLIYLPWIGLSIIFCYLSLDEFIQFHEYLVLMTKKFFNLSGMGTAYWIIPYLTIFVILGVIYFKFMISLERKTLKLFILAGIVFVGGAVGFELISERYSEFHGSENVIYELLYTCEEFLEMLGVIIFIYALTSYKTFTIKIE